MHSTWDVPFRFVNYSAANICNSDKGFIEALIECLNTECPVVRIRKNIELLLHKVTVVEPKGEDVAI